MGKLFAVRNFLLASLAIAYALAFSPSKAAAQSYSYRRSVTIDHTKVANTDQTNFPVVVSGTYSYLATVANGGKVQNSNGYDIIFTSDAAGSTKLDHEIESYNASTGAVAFWVRIPTLSHTTDTVIYMQYGNSSITTSQENKTGVWDSHFQGVWHLTSLSDSTTNNYTLAGYNGGSAPSSLSSGKIGGAKGFVSASTQNAGISGSSSPNLQITGSQTWEMWVNSASLASGLERGPMIFNSSSTVYVGLYAYAGALTFSTSGVSGSTVVNSSVTPTNNTWFHVVGVYDATAAKHRIYVNGTKTEVATTGSHATQNNGMTLGDASDYSSHQYADESLDEIRISNTARSDDWITTEYNNQNAPSTFSSVGVENAPTITGLSPSSGVVGASVSISGSAFGTSAGTVTFNGQAATITSWSDTSIATAVPSGAASGPVIVTTSGAVQSNAFAFALYSGRRAIVIDHTKVPNVDQVNFPVLISGTYGYLATVSNGGRVQNASGYDIIFSSDAADTQQLDHEIETYDPVTGNIKLWVRVPTLSHTVDTVLYMHYGNTGISASQEHKAGVWDANYKGVWHLGNGSSLNVSDSTANANNGTNNAATPTAGEIGGAASFSGSSQSVALPSLGTFSTSGKLSVSAWVNSNSASGQHRFLSLTGSTDTFAASMLTNGNTFVAETGTATVGGDDASDTAAFSTGQWYYVVGTFDESGVSLFVNGVKKATTRYNNATNSTATANGWSIGKYTENLVDYYFWNGAIDEVRCSTVVRSPDWIAAEYNNQGSPGTFYSVSAENAVGISVTPHSGFLYPSQTQQFSATVTNAATQSVTWSVSPNGIGSVTSGGLYTAPSTISSQQTVTVTATSSADGTKTASATVTLSPPIAVSVAPVSITLSPSQSKQFTASLTNTSNNAVTWSLSPAGVGAISSSGLYSAPATISAQQTVTITATSVVDTSKSGTATVTLSPAAGVFSYRRAITIDHTKIPNSDLVDFPVLISGTYSYLATTANGGKVQSSNGYDIVFTTDANGSTKLDHEIETYDPVTGTINFWVRIPSLPHTADTAIYLQYGDAAISSSQENRAGVWNSNYLAVWHLANGAALNLSDSTANANNGTNNGATPTTGRIDGAAALNGTNQFIGIGSLGTIYNAGSWTLSAWAKPGSNSGTQKILALSGSTNTVDGTAFSTFVANLNETNGKFVAEAARATTSTDDATDTGAFTTGQWYYLAGTFGGDMVTLYVNGTRKAITPYNTASTSLANNNGWSIGKYVENGTDQQWWNGSVDEVRISRSARSGDWIAAEYNNQNSPTTFYSVGAENTVSVNISPTTSALYAAQTQQFTATTIDAANPAVTWTISPSGTGAISSSGLYTAPSSISTQQTVTVAVTSTQDNTKTASAVVTLYPPATVTVTPGSSILSLLQTQQFSATVTNAATQSVIWSVSPPGIGSIASSGLYTAPATISSQQTVVITATSVADSTKTGSASVTLVPASQAASYRRMITIDHTKVANTDQANFPVLVSGTYSYLATVAKGGKVQNANGYDIIFTSDAAGSVKLDHEIESYNASTGAVAFWVRIPTLSHTTDTVIYMQYGNSSITTSQENKTGVWDSHFQGVWHLTSLVDSTSNGYNLAGYNGGSAPSSLGSGKIGGAKSFASASSQNAGISGSSSPNLQITGSQTWEMWINSASLASGLERGPTMFNSSSTVYVALYANAGAFTFATSGVSGSTVVNSSVTPTNNTWFHVAGVYDATAAKHRIYVNGTKTEVATTGSHTTQNNSMTVGDASDYSSHQYSDDSLDEIRISNTARSDDWITTEYNNQSSPSTFYALSAENTVLILSLSPSSGEPGTSVTIAGSSFGASTGTVTFNGTSATTSSWSDTSIVAVAPNGATSGPVRVTNSGSLQSNGFNFAVLAPSISSLNPHQGAAGTSVTISGSNFGSSAGSVTFNGHAATTSSWSDTSITSTVPSGAGVGNVVVTHGGLQSNGVMFGGPFISSLSPTSGVPGSSVTITGSNFGTTAGGVTFAGTSATPSSWSDSSIVVPVPANALSGAVIVTNQGINSNSVTFTVLPQVFNGTVSYSYDELGRLVGVVAASGDAAKYNYDAVGNILSITRTPGTTPTVQSFSPTSGPVGASVTISGSNFSATVANDTVKFNGTTATISSASATQLVVTVPAGATTGTISVTSPAGTATSSNSFTVTSSSGKPGISSFTPQIVSAGGTVTISGVNFDATPANNRLIVNTTPAAIPTSVSSSSMVLTVPSSTGSGRISLSTPAGAVTSASDLFISSSTVVYTGRAALGSATTVSISTPGIGLLLFEGVAGKTVSISSSSATFTDCSFRVYDPNGNGVGNAASCATSSFLDAQTLMSTGTYTVIVTPTSGVPGSVVLTLNDSTNVFTPIPSGGSGLTVTTTVPGQNASLTFSAVGGQQATVQFTSNTFGSVTASLIAPDGTVVTSMASSASSFSLPTVSLPASGLFTVLIDPAGTATGSIHVGLTLQGSITGVPARPAGSTLDTGNSLSTSLVGLFVMNEGNGTTDKNLVDSQIANFSGAALPVWRATDPSISFQGGASLNSYLDAGADLNFDQLTPNQMTVVAKVFLGSVTAGGIAEKNDQNVDSGFVFGFDSTGALRLTVEKNQANMQVASASGTVLSQEWVQVAFTWDGTGGTAASAHLFLNGVEQTKAISVDGSGTIGYTNATNQPFRIGNATFDPVAGSFNGRIAYLAVYKGRILTTTEMGQLDAHLPVH